MSGDAHALARRTSKPVPGKSGSVPSGTLVKQLEITVILDEPIEADDKWEVVGGGQKIILTAGHAEPLVKGHKILRFKVKPSKSGYKLIHHCSSGFKRPVFLENPFPLPITKGTKSQTAKDAYAHLLSQVPDKLPDRYATQRDVDPDLKQDSPVLVDLKVQDPKL